MQILRCAQDDRLWDWGGAYLPAGGAGAGGWHICRSLACLRLRITKGAKGAYVPTNGLNRYASLSKRRDSAEPRNIGNNESCSSDCLRHQLTVLRSVDGRQLVG